MVGLGQGAQIGNFGRDGPDKYVFGKIKKRIVGLGQGAQIGNFGRDGPDKYCLLENQRREW